MQYLRRQRACVRRGKAIPPQQGPQRQPERIYPIQIPHEYVRTQVRRYDEPRAWVGSFVQGKSPLFFISYPPRFWKMLIGPFFSQDLKK